MITANVSLLFLKQDNMSDEIYCPEDIVTYYCSIESNTEKLYLVWSVTFPEFLPLEITYDSSSLLGNIDDLDMNVNASLIDYTENFIESVISITVRGIDFITSGTVIECSIGDLDKATITLLVNISGKYKS